MLYVVTTFPILAPLPVSDNGSALGLYIFIRSFFSAWGLTIGSTVLENQLKRHSPNINTRRTSKESSARRIVGLLGGAVAGPAGDIGLGVIEHVVDERGADANGGG